MRAEDIAANVPPLTREYISLAIQEAIQPAIEEIFTEISAVKAMASKSPNLSALAAEVAQTVEASIGSGLSNIINQRTAQFRADLDDALSLVRQDLEACQRTADTAISSISDLIRQTPAPAQDPTPAIEQAIAPLAQSIASIGDRLSSLPNPTTMASAISTSVEASLASSVASIIEQRSDLLRQDIDGALEALREETAKTEASANLVLTAVADLEVRVRKWLDSDRYSITRAHVLKAMKESSNG